MTEENQAVDDEASQVAWWMRWLATAAGVIGGVTATLGGIMKFIGGILHITSILGALIMVALGFLMFVLEATFFCRTINVAQPVIQRMDKIRFWHKGAIYCGLSMISFILLTSSGALSTIAALIMPFATGTLYGLMSLGRKADREQMLQSARGDNYQQFENEPEGP